MEKQREANQMSPENLSERVALLELAQQQGLLLEDMRNESGSGPIYFRVEDRRYIAYVTRRRDGALRYIRFSDARNHKTLNVTTVHRLYRELLRRKPRPEIPLGEAGQSHPQDEQGDHSDRFEETKTIVKSAMGTYARSTKANRDVSDLILTAAISSMPEQWRKFMYTMLEALEEEYETNLEPLAKTEHENLHHE